MPKFADETWNIMTFFVSTFESFSGLPDVVGFILVGVFGAAVGSFLNVVIHRVPREESIVFPNSACPKCGAAIKQYDNIPILSWLLLRGKCRGCKEPISIRYPAVELLNAVLWLLVFWQFGLSPLLPVGLFLVSVIVALMFIDAEHMILPNAITYPFLLFALSVRLVLPLVFGGAVFSDMSYSPLSGILVEYPAAAVSLLGAILGAAAGGGSLWFVGEVWKRFRGVEAMGLGDVKMMFGVGALLGWRLSLLSIFIAAFAGAIVGGVLIASKKDKSLQTQIPFGIFLGIGSIAAFLFGERIIAWYVNNFIP